LISKSPLSNHTIFLDRNFGRYQVAAALRAIGLTVEVHYDHFPEAEEGETDDTYWIKPIAEKGWVIFTRDREIRRNPLERKAFIDAKARVFNIRNGNATADKVANAIRLAAARIARILDNDSPPYLVGVSINGDLTFIDDTSQKSQPDKVRRALIDGNG